MIASGATCAPMAPRYDMFRVVNGPSDEEVETVRASLESHLTALGFDGVHALLLANDLCSKIADDVFRQQSNRLSNLFPVVNATRGGISYAGPLVSSPRKVSLRMKLRRRWNTFGPVAAVHSFRQRFRDARCVMDGTKFAYTEDQLEDL